MVKSDILFGLKSEKHKSSLVVKYINCNLVLNFEFCFELVDLTLSAIFLS